MVEIINVAWMGIMVLGGKTKTELSRLALALIERRNYGSVCIYIINHEDFLIKHITEGSYFC